MELLQRNFRNHPFVLHIFGLHLRKFIPMSVQSSYQKAFFFAAQKHQQANQVVNGTTDVPYAVHLGNVAMEILMAYQAAPVFDVETAVQIALLHDVLEDTACSETELKESFGEPIAVGVKALTKMKNVIGKTPMEDSLERILACPSEVGMVKLADRITNLQPPPQHWSKGKIDEYFNEATTILDQLGFLNAALSERMKQQMNVYRSFF